MKFLESIRRVGAHQGLRASAANAFWLSSDVLTRFVTAFFIGLWVARYLGPEPYGRLQYAQSWVELFNAIAWLGVGYKVVLNLVRGDATEGELLGNAFALRLLGSALAIVLTITIGSLIVGTHSSVDALIWILCLSILFNEAPGGILLWFQSRTQLRYPMVAKNLVTLFGAGCRAGLILIHASLIAFAWVVVVEAIVLCGALFGIYKLYGRRVSDWRFNYHGALRMLRQGVPIIFASLAAGLNSRIDRLMLGWFTDFHEVGIYAAATRFSEIWWVIPSILTISLVAEFVYPEQAKHQLQRRVAWISAGLLAIAMIPCMVMFFASKPLIAGLLGSKYIGGVPVLMIHIWTAIFIFLDAPAMHYLVATDRQSVLIMKSVGALIINAALGVLLIPRYGPVGAAIATLVAQAWGGCVFYMIHPRVRDVSRIQAAALYQLLWGWWYPKTPAP